MTPANTPAVQAGPVRLSPTMLAVLSSIVNPRLDENPFPPAGTVNALLRRGLIREVKIKPKTAFEMLMGRHCVHLRPTPRGKAALVAALPTDPQSGTTEGASHG